MLRTCLKAVQRSNLKWMDRTICTSTVKYSDDVKKALTQNEPQIIDDNLILSDDACEANRRQGLITVESNPVIASISGIPIEHIKNRHVRIFQPVKNVMQAGVENRGHWEAEFDNRQRWENPLMGWCSTGDPHSNLKLEFATKDAAISYCEKYGYKWFINEANPTRTTKPKSYGINFAWNKRTRVSTK